MSINRLTRDDVYEFQDNLTNLDPRLPNALDHYQEIATQSAIYPNQRTPLGLIYVALKLNGEAGELAEHVGKAMRDEDLVPIVHEGDDAYSVEFYELLPNRRDLIIKEIGDVLWYLSAACNELGISLSEAAVANLEKLADRTERDALRGSGDER